MILVWLRELLGWGLSLALGFLIVERFLGNNSPLSFWFKCAFGWGVGTGCDSLLWFWTWCRGAGTPAWVPALVESIAVLALLAFRTGGATKQGPAPPRWFWVAVAPFITFAAFYFLSLTIRGPYGDWDAWLIWNLHARALFVAGGRAWKTLSPQLAFTHPDYPLHLPLSVARLWLFSGTDSPSAPQLIAFTYTLATSLLLSLAVFHWKGPKSTFVALAVLLSSTRFLWVGAVQYADIPLAFYLLSGVVLLALYESTERRSLLLLSAAQFGFALWTKNEGALLIVSFAAGVLVLSMCKVRLHALLHSSIAFAALTPAIVTYLIFKLKSHTSSDVWDAARAPGILSRLFNLNRLEMLLKTGALILWHSETWLFSGVLVMLLYVVSIGFAAQNPLPIVTRLVTVAFLFHLTGLCLIYLIGIADLSWYLTTSLDRLCIQLWPTTLFVLFVATRVPFD